MAGHKAELAECIGGEEGGLERADLGIGQMQFALDIGGRDGERGAVDVIDQGGNYEKNEDAPLFAREGRARNCGR